MPLSDLRQFFFLCIWSLWYKGKRFENSSSYSSPSTHLGKSFHCSQLHLFKFIKWFETVDFKHSVSVNFCQLIELFKQWCAGKLVFWGRGCHGELWFIAFDNFQSINTPTMADFQLPVWCQWTKLWEEMLVISSFEPVHADLLTPL